LVVGQNSHWGGDYYGDFSLYYALEGALNDSGLTPVEFYVVVRLDAAEEKTAGGIILTKQTQDADKLSCEEGVLVAVSPLAFNYDAWPEGSRKPQVGDRVIFKRYDGLLKERNGKNFRLINDKSVVAIVEPDLDPRELPTPEFMQSVNRWAETNGLREAAMDRVGEVEG
jgi:co-chaperonin GroES (HSP10)